MATHNQARIVGYLLEDPVIQGNERSRTVIFKVRTTHRETENPYHYRVFEDILVYYDDNTLDGFMHRVVELKAFDLVDIKGVFNVMLINKPSICPECNCQNVKRRATSTFIYPISLMKRGNLKCDSEYRESLPGEILQKHFKEISNQVLIIGTVLADPETTGTTASPACRYPLGVDRKYYIRTQGEITADYPWVYSYGKQAVYDSEHLKKGSVILVDAYLRNRQVKNNMTCVMCGKNYTFDDVAMEFIPYSVEYLSNFYTDADIVERKESEMQAAARSAKRALGL